MASALTSLLLIAALVVWWLAQPRPAQVRLCGHCGDLVEAATALPVRCPTCSGWLWTV